MNSSELDQSGEQQGSSEWMKQFPEALVVDRLQGLEVMLDNPDSDLLFVSGLDKSDKFPKPQAWFMPEHSSLVVPPYADVYIAVVRMEDLKRFNAEEHPVFDFAQLARGAVVHVATENVDVRLDTYRYFFGFKGHRYSQDKVSREVESLFPVRLTPDNNTWMFEGMQFCALHKQTLGVLGKYDASTWSPDPVYSSPTPYGPWGNEGLSKNAP